MVAFTAAAAVAVPEGIHRGKIGSKLATELTGLRAFSRKDEND
jgi:hypothetical protein